MSAEPIYLSDYQAPSYLVDNVELVFDLAPTATRVRSKIKFRPNPDQPDRMFFLHGVDLKTISASIDGKPVELTPLNEGVTCPAPNAPFLWEAEVEINPQANTALEGLYMSNGMYCTQCEAEGFRKITYYPDRPDVLAPFHVRINGDLPVLLSNGNPTAQGDGWAEWNDPWPKPAYLFALVAGELFAHPDTFTTQSGRNVELNIWVRDGDQDKCRFGMQALKSSMAWDERVYGCEYDLDVFNVVAVDDFNMGAMENKGLNIFNSSCILARDDMTTDAGFERVEAIVAHEYFHNWTGNRVTCRDWFQLCLKEGLTVFRDSQFTADMRSAPVKRISDAKIMRTAQFREDGGPLAHPVRPASFVEINNFYTITVYEKGAELIHMLKTLVGDENYYKSVRHYLDQHDGRAATIEDWLSSFETITGRDLSQFKIWYEQAGTPRLDVRETFENGTLRLDIAQSTPPAPQGNIQSPRLIPIAIGLLSQDGQEVRPTQVLEMTQDRQTFEFHDLDQAPIVSILRGFSAPVIVTTQATNAQRAVQLAYDTDPYCRWDAGQALGMDVVVQKIQGKPADDALWLDAIHKLLGQDDIDPALRAFLSTLPPADSVAQHLADQGLPVDPDQIETVLNDLSQALAEKTAQDLPNLYEKNRVREPYAPTAEQAGKRALGNRVMSLMSRLDQGKLALAEFNASDNMTQSLAALVALVNFGDAKSALDQFYEKWQSERLVIDLWFSTQIVNAPAKRAVQTARDLIAHPDFTLKNPNRVRSVLSALAGNFAGFHNADGSGYQLLADMLIQLDPINPQVCARMSSAFATWKRFDTKRQDLLLAQIDRILAQPNLSNDTREMLSRMRG